jgi:6-pyruvoyltetrahydropterin/6-carboxytetrahydropterin synthase
MLRLAKRYRFSASHRLHSALLSESENQAMFGKCNNPYGHGHDYILEVVVRGNADSETGLLVPIQLLDGYVSANVLADFDHKYMNQQIPAFEDTPPTTENVATEIRRRLLENWNDTFSGAPILDSIRIFETRRNIVELNA